jgi:hypothetical protein
MHLGNAPIVTPLKHIDTICSKADEFFSDLLPGQTPSSNKALSIIGKQTINPLPLYLCNIQQQWDPNPIQDNIHMNAKPLTIVAAGHLITIDSNKLSMLDMLLQSS